MLTVKDILVFQQRPDKFTISQNGKYGLCISLVQM